MARYFNIDHKKVKNNGQFSGITLHNERDERYMAYADTEHINENESSQNIILKRSKFRSSDSYLKSCKTRIEKANEPIKSYNQKEREKFNTNRLKDYMQTFNKFNHGESTKIPFAHPDDFNTGFNSYLNDYKSKQKDESQRISKLKLQLKKQIKDKVDEDKLISIPDPKYETPNKKAFNRMIKDDKAFSFRLVVQASNEALSREEHIQFLKDADEFFKERFKNQEILESVIHTDEEVPHLHLHISYFDTNLNKFNQMNMIDDTDFNQLNKDFEREIGSKYNLKKGKSRDERIQNLDADLKDFIENFLNNVENVKERRELQKKLDRLIGYGGNEHLSPQQLNDLKDKQLLAQEKRLEEVKDKIQDIESLIPSNKTPETLKMPQIELETKKSILGKETIILTPNDWKKQQSYIKKLEASHKEIKNELETQIRWRKIMNIENTSIVKMRAENSSLKVEKYDLESEIDKKTKLIENQKRIIANNSRDDILLEYRKLESYKEDSHKDISIREDKLTKDIQNHEKNKIEENREIEETKKELSEAYNETLKIKKANDANLKNIKTANDNLRERELSLNVLESDYEVMNKLKEATFKDKLKERNITDINPRNIRNQSDRKRLEEASNGNFDNIAFNDINKVADTAEKSLTRQKSHIHTR